MNATEPIVRIVDDDASFLAATARMLRASGFAVRTFGSAAQFLNQAELDVPGCVLLDLQMPEINGLELQETLATLERRLPVIFLSGQGDIPASVKAMRRGAEDFLTKLAPKEALLDAVQRAFDRDARERAERARLAALHGRFAALTSRESEVLRHVVAGKLNKQIAFDLAIHERTVKLHRTAIMTKLKVTSVAELTKLWVKVEGHNGSRHSARLRPCLRFRPSLKGSRQPSHPMLPSTPSTILQRLKNLSSPNSCRVTVRVDSMEAQRYCLSFRCLR
jgi:FixJ family two-component response regulator